MEEQKTAVQQEQMQKALSELSERCFLLEQELSRHTLSAEEEESLCARVDELEKKLLLHDRNTRTELVLTLYINYGSGFQQDDIILQHTPISGNDGKVDISFELPKAAKEVRFDPGESACLLQKWRVLSPSASFYPANGYALSAEHFLFTKNDPMLLLQDKKDFPAGTVFRFSFDYHVVSNPEEFRQMMDCLSGSELSAKLKGALHRRSFKSETPFSIYSDYGNGFHAADVLTESVEIVGKQTSVKLSFELPQAAKRLRFDPGDTACFITNWRVTSGNAQFRPANGQTLSESTFLFQKIDPQLISEARDGYPAGTVLTFAFDYWAIENPAAVKPLLDYITLGAGKNQNTPEYLRFALTPVSDGKTAREKEVCTVAYSKRWTAHTLRFKIRSASDTFQLSLGGLPCFVSDISVSHANVSITAENAYQPSADTYLFAEAEPSMLIRSETPFEAGNTVTVRLRYRPLQDAELAQMLISEGRLTPAETKTHFGKSGFLRHFRKLRV